MAEVLEFQLSHPYMTTGKSIALTRWTFVGKAMSLLFTEEPGRLQSMGSHRVLPILCSGPTSAACRALSQQQRPPAGTGLRALHQHPPFYTLCLMGLLFFFIAKVACYLDLVKAMVFPVVKYGCESWTVKKAEH